MSATAQHAATSLRASARASSGAPTESRNGVEDWSRIVVATVARGVLAALLGLAFWAAAPAVVGWQPTTVVTGSMEPRIRVGDVVVSRPMPMDRVETGHVLLADDPDQPGHLRLHRYAEALPDGLMMTKGDANPDPDSTPIGADAVHGVGFLRVPSVGLPVVWAREGAWGPVALVALAVVALLALSTADRRLRLERAEAVCVAIEGEEARVGARPGVPSPGAAAASAVGALPGLPAWPSRRLVRHRARRLRRLRTASAALTLAMVVTAPLATMPTEAAAAPFSARTSTSASLTAGTITLPTGVTCVNNEGSASGSVTISWTHSGATPPNGFSIVAGTSASTVVATASATATSVVYRPTGLLQLGSQTLKVRADYGGTWTGTSTAGVGVRILSLVGAGNVACP